LISDRDPKWSGAMEALLRTVGVRAVRTPPASPDCNAHAERFVRSIKAECLDRVIPVGEWHLRRLVNELIERSPVRRTSGPVRRRESGGGILSYYYRSAV
jgi:putative transposase